MRHKAKGRKFKRSRSQRKALLKHLAEAIILQKRIKTTTAKAKELSPYIEKLVTLAKKQNLSSAKLIHSRLADEAAKRLIADVAKKYGEKKGGYVRVVKLGRRKGDAAELSIIEFV